MRAVPWAAFAAAYLSAWFVATAVPLPLVWYLPLGRRFLFAAHTPELAVDYYGRVLLCLLAGAAAALVAQAAARRGRWLSTLLVWSLGLLAFTSSLTIYTLAHRQPIPAALPPGYVAR